MRHRLRWVATVLASVVLLGALVGLAACGSQVADQTSVRQSDTTSRLVTTTEASTTTSTPAVSSTSSSAAATPNTSEGAAAVEYRNTDYGFTFSLPESWQGYSLVTEQWEGFPNNTNGPNQGDAPVHGPEILIRHPEWTASNPRQNIPIMVFTLAQWALVQQEKLSVGAAPIPPTELGRNATYVFALPARYNYAFPTGYEEVEKILEGTPLQGF